MTGWTLSLKQAPALRLDVAWLRPDAFAPLSLADIERLPLWQGRERLAVADFFGVAASETEGLTLVGDLSRCDRVGAGLTAGRLTVDGSVGHQLALSMSGGAVQVRGDAGEQAGVELAGGRVEITGSAGDWLASALPGSLDGMRGGTLIVRGSVGARAADRMRRGLVLIEGDAGDFLACRMVAGTVALLGACGRHPAHGMRRGSLILAGERGAGADLGPTFVPTNHDVAVAWALMARAIEAESAALAGLAARSIQRWAGDLAVDGRGECFTPVI